MHTHPFLVELEAVKEFREKLESKNFTILEEKNPEYIIGKTWVVVEYDSSDSERVTDLCLCAQYLGALEFKLRGY